MGKGKRLEKKRRAAPAPGAAREPLEGLRFSSDGVAEARLGRRQRSAALDLDSAVGREDADHPAAVAQRGLDLTIDPALDHDGEIDLHPAVHGAGLEASVVIARDQDLDSTVRRFHIQPFSVPAVTGQVDGDSTIGGSALDVTGEVSEVDAPVGRPESDVARHILDGDAAVRALQVEVAANTPDVSAHLANTLIEVLEERNLSVKREEVSSVRQFIEDQLESVREKLKDSEEELNVFKEENRVLTLNKESEALLDRMTDVETSYNEASTEKGALEQQLQAIRDEMVANYPLAPDGRQC